MLVLESIILKEAEPPSYAERQKINDKTDQLYFYLPLYKKTMKINRSILKLIFFFAYLNCTAFVILDALHNIDPNQILVTDISHQILMTDVAKVLNVSYLSQTKLQFQRQKIGSIWGKGVRSFVNLPVQVDSVQCQTQINVIFFIDTGSPITTLTEEVLYKLKDKCPSINEYQSFFSVFINKRKIFIKKSDGYYSNLNVLGTNFLRRNDIRLSIKYFINKGGIIKLVFDSQDQVKDEDL